MSMEKFAMVKIDQGGGDVEWVRADAIQTLKGFKDDLHFVGLASGRLIDAMGSIGQLMRTLEDAIEQVTE